MDIDTIFDVRFAPRLRFGKGSLACIGEELQTNGLGKCLLVTDPGIVKAGFADSTLGLLRRASVQVDVFSEVVPNPGTRTVEKGLEAYRQNNCDCLLAVGGGSSIDTAKAIGILATNGLQPIRLCCYVVRDTILCKQLPVKRVALFIPHSGRNKKRRHILNI